MKKKTRNSIVLNPPTTVKKYVCTTAKDKEVKRFYYMHKCNLFTFVHQNATWLLKIMERNNDNANGIRHFCIVMFVCAGSWWPYIIAILVKANTKASEMVTNYFCFTIFEWIIFRFVCGARQPTQWFVLPCSMHENALYMENAPISLAQTRARCTSCTAQCPCPISIAKCTKWHPTWPKKRIHHNFYCISLVAENWHQKNSFGILSFATCLLQNCLFD